MKTTVSDKKALEQLEKGFENAKEVLNDKSKVNKLFVNLEQKLAKYPKILERVSRIPVLIEMVKAYVTKTYTEIPKKSIIAIISGLIYLVLPVDLIPDFIPGLGYIDDVSVLSICIELVYKDVLSFEAWKASNKAKFESTK